jgi:hypothetical protein
VVIENVTAVLPEDTAITVEDNCEVRIVGSSITARRGIRASGNGRVAVENSRIDASSTAIWADGNKRIELLDSEVTAQEIGIHASGNVKVSLTGGRVSGNPALSMKKAKLDNHGAELVDLAPPAAPKARPGRADKADRRRARRARQQAE